MDAICYGKVPSLSTLPLPQSIDRKPLTLFVQVFLLVVLQLGPACRRPEAEHPPVGQLALDALPPDDQHKEDEHPVQTVDRVDDDPKPGLGHQTFAHVERQDLEHPDQPGQQEQLQIQHALVPEWLFSIRAKVVPARMQMQARPDEQENVYAQHHAQR